MNIENRFGKGITGKVIELRLEELLALAALRDRIDNHLNTKKNVREIIEDSEEYVRTQMISVFLNKITKGVQSLDSAETELFRPEEEIQGEER